MEAEVMNPHLFLTVEDSDSVRVYGAVYSSEEKETIEKIVKGIKGIEKMTNDLVVFKGSMAGA